MFVIVNAARCTPRAERAAAGQVAIQAWTGSGVVGPIDVMSPRESPRQGQGDNYTGQGELGWALLGLVGGGPGLLGRLLVGLGLRQGPGPEACQIEPSGWASLKLGSRAALLGPGLGWALLAWVACARLVSDRSAKPGQQEVMLRTPKIST